MAKSAIVSAAEATAVIKKIREDLSRQRDSVTEQITQLNERNAFVCGLPVTREEGKRFVLELVDLSANGFLKRTSYAKFIERIAYPQAGVDASHGNFSQRPLSTQDVENVRANGFDRLGLWPRNFLVGMIDAHGIRDDALAFFFGDLIKAKLEAHLDYLFPDYAEDQARRTRPEWHGHYANATEAELASSIEDRLTEIRANKEKIARLVERLDELDEALASMSN